MREVADITDKVSDKLSAYIGPEKSSASAMVA